MYKIRRSNDYDSDKAKKFLHFSRIQYPVAVKKMITLQNHLYCTI